MPSISAQDCFSAQPPSCFYEMRVSRRTYGSSSKAAATHYDFVTLSSFQ
jgi:hypothetical protein